MSKKLRRLRDRYESALDHAQKRRHEYHLAVLEAHESGVPLREIATQVGLSHQRVHQIIESLKEETKPTKQATSDPATASGPN